MKHSTRLLALGACAFGLCSTTANAASTDTLTGLPLYPGSPFTMDLPAYTYCGVPGSSGDIYAVSYDRFSRPLTPVAMASITEHEVKCR